MEYFFQLGLAYAETGFQDDEAIEALQVAIEIAEDLNDQESADLYEGRLRQLRTESDN